MTRAVTRLVTQPPTDDRPVGALRIVEVGWSTTVQDRGRPGYADVGVPLGGAVDRRAHGHANRLVGNGESAASFETLGGLVVEALRPIVVASSPDGQRSTLGAGDRVTVPAPADGVWAYLAVRGGLNTSVVLDSMSHDTLSGLGPPAVSVDAEFDIGPEPAGELPAELAPLRRTPRRIGLWRGPRHGWFVDPIAQLVARRWTVGNDVSRVGVRLDAGAFVHSDTAPSAAMPSEGLTEGAIQITPSGEPIIMLANHPTTGGYPVVAVVDPDDLHLVANARPGTELAFRRPATALHHHGVTAVHDDVRQA